MMNGMFLFCVCYAVQVTTQMRCKSYCHESKPVLKRKKVARLTSFFTSFPLFENYI